MTDTTTIIAQLSGSEKFIIQWLAKEDRNSLGECESLEQRVLVNMGLAKIEEVEGVHRGFWNIYCTPLGYEVAKALAANGGGS